MEREAQLQQTPSLKPHKLKKDQPREKRGKPRRWPSETFPKTCAQRFGQKHFMIAQVVHVKHHTKNLPIFICEHFPFLHLKTTCGFQSASTNRLADNIHQEMLDMPLFFPL